jgi:DNA-binding transcriptional LysR family regulator
MADKNCTEIDWQDMRTFLALARHGSLSAAARTLLVNHATVARRLRTLEASLGAKLVERRPEGYILTPAGQQALEAASDMENAALRLGQGASDDAPSGLVRVNAPPGLAAGFLTERLAALASRHASLDIELATNVRSVSLERHETDIAIRMGRPEDGGMIARPLVTVAFGFYGSEAMRRRVKDGEEPIFVGFDEADAFVPEAVWLSRRFPGARRAFRANSQVGQALAARSGAGIALLPHYIWRTELTLHHIDLGAVPAPREVFILTRPRDRTDFAIRVVAQGIVEIFAKKKALFN